MYAARAVLLFRGRAVSRRRGQLVRPSRPVESDREQPLGRGPRGTNERPPAKLVKTAEV